MASGINIQELVDQVVNIISPSSSLPNATEDQWKQLFNKIHTTKTNEAPLSMGKPNEAPLSTGYQNPIKTTYYCSGVFGSGDARHKGIHNGVDLRVAGGTSVYPITEGVVINVTNDSKGGNSISIQHANKITSRYAHMGTISVYPGEQVGKNTVIGSIGNSGNAANTAPHIHLEIKENGQFVNPNKYVYVPPYSNLQEEEKNNLWLSQDHKNAARSFNVNKHLAGRTALASKINKLEKIANIYYQFTNDF
jgi:murein DD-endopeptidase MepM/ murein hydrolase activator NlpD